MTGTRIAQASCMQSAVQTATRRSTGPATSASRSFAAVQLILRSGKSPSSSWAFNALDHRRTISVGSSADSDWQITAEGMADHALWFSYDGHRAFVRAFPNVYACRDGIALSQYEWTELADRSSITVGAACLVVRGRADSSSVSSASHKRVSSVRPSKRTEYGPTTLFPARSPEIRSRFGALLVPCLVGMLGLAYLWWLAWLD